MFISRYMHIKSKHKYYANVLNVGGGQNIFTLKNMKIYLFSVWKNVQKTKIKKVFWTDNSWYMYRKSKIKKDFWTDNRSYMYRKLKINFFFELIIAHTCTRIPRFSVILATKIFLKWGIKNPYCRQVVKELYEE